MTLYPPCRPHIINIMDDPVPTLQATHYDECPCTHPAGDAVHDAAGGAAPSAAVRTGAQQLPRVQPQPEQCGRDHTTLSLYPEDSGQKN